MATETGLDSHLLVHFQLQSTNQRIYSVTHRYTLTGGSVNATTIPEIAEQLAAGFKADFIAVLPTTCKFVGAHVIYYGGATQLEAYSTTAAGGAGAAEGESLPEEDCVCIRKRTGLAGRTHRGRIFMPLVPESLQNESRLTDDAILLYNALAYKFKTVWAFDAPLTGLVGTPKHAAFHAGTLDTITETGAVVDVLNRRDRRDPRQLIYQPTAA